jgi:hypothetical protein
MFEALDGHEDNQEFGSAKDLGIGKIITKTCTEDLGVGMLE